MFDVNEANPEWPRMMEFTISNTCNLGLRITGALAHSLRAFGHGEGLPRFPRPTAISSLTISASLHHHKIRQVPGRGALPCRRVDAYLGHHARRGCLFSCNVTTNGTQWNGRVEKVLERFPSHVHLDGRRDERDRREYPGQREIRDSS